MSTWIMMCMLVLHMISIDGLVRASQLIGNGNLWEAVVTSVATAFSVLVVGWALAKALSWFGD